MPLCVHARKLRAWVVIATLWDASSRHAGIRQCTQRGRPRHERRAEGEGAKRRSGEGEGEARARPGAKFEAEAGPWCPAGRPVRNPGGTSRPPAAGIDANVGIKVVRKKNQQGTPKKG